ncbi:Ubiquitin carboxyl-terminal hydrolase [Fasciola hepatica]|uniref:Ubiquitin carboxyl-terminal hydrolase n=1 Tax=Fasciola hepatica TaxID=6192 RepID=A0A4E0S1S0_FASHE|nr:Ubiquitin carboxyl-terminal hydrolase [Fasciola hepatica]
MRWIPLESNPEVMNQFISKLGIEDGWEFVDVYGLDPELLAMVPKPVLAVMVLYPISKKTEGQPLGEPAKDSSLMFIKQTIGNACGTVALLHAVTNNQDHLKFRDRSVLDQLIQTLKDLEPSERGEAMEREKILSTLHEDSATMGQTEAPEASSKTNLHFICFVEHKGGLYELGKYYGRKNSPIYHGPSSSTTLLEDTGAVINRFIQRDPDNLNFTMVALSKKP